MRRRGKKHPPSAPVDHGRLIDLLDNNSFTTVFEFYFFSLSRHEDDPQQWRDYGQQGRGFAIGFAPALFAPTEMTLKQQANENLHVGRVIYGDAATEARHRLVIEKAASITSRVAWANRSLLKEVKPITYLLAMAREVIASQLIWNCQARNLCERTRGALYHHYKGKTYVEAPLALKAAGVVMQVLVRPNAPSDAEIMVTEFLKTNGYQDSIPVRRSSAIV
jgi:DUF2971 family protein